MDAKEKLLNDLNNLKEKYMNEYFYNCERYVPDGDVEFEESDDYCIMLNNLIDEVERDEV